MRTRPTSLLFLLPLLVAFQPRAMRAQESKPPHLEKRGNATQLIVDGKPFLILGGELHNSSSSSLEYMKPIWPRLQAMGLNAVFTPLSWELVEPTEGTFDFSLVDGLIQQARAAHERIVFLWLASWKNGMSSYAPVWVKQDTKRFPRVTEFGREVEILSPLGKATQEADAHAFTALMRHIRQVDGSQHTVLMMQVENEVGVLGDARDHSPAANAAFDGEVPATLTSYLQAHRATLDADLRELWDANGDKTSGTWGQVFGTTQRADEIFMAWHYARYIQAVTAAGKAAYDLPMYVNTWLEGETTPPGQYPSGCPEPRVIDVWQAAAPSIDLYAPDLYDPDFIAWSRRFHRNGNPLFLAETRGREAGAANVFYALGEEAAISFSPFGIESEAGDTDPLADSYHLISHIEPLLLAHQSAGDVRGFVLDREHSTADFTMNGVTLHVSLDRSFGHEAESGFGLIMAMGKDEFLGAGKGFMVTFTQLPETSPQIGIASITEGKYENGQWIPGRRLNGDENDQGQHWEFSPRSETIERITLYPCAQ
jgi:beta-galactosidase GanA